ncbi:hypothetical protein DdX_03701 [Ditylenchus destructor]|uniref:Uncharacterized protein n=1 Tax=Ditylenchus destructor TaxID=166010 RepID=A0AAD4NAK7_9BILA|nr:hypothetical protein DdX_03701 [Ditylenchus destructor]
MQEAGQTQRDDGTQIWQQKQSGPQGAAATYAMSMDMYGQVSNNAAALPPHNVGGMIGMYPMEVQDYAAAQHPASYQQIYHYANQQTALYPNNHDIYPNSGMAYAAIPAAYNTAQYSTPYAQPPPMPMKNGQQQPTFANMAHSHANNYAPTMHPQQAASAGYYITPYVQQASVGSVSGVNGGMVSQQPQQLQNQLNSTAPILKDHTKKTAASMFDNGMENYTASWVSSTSSIPPDMKISPDHVSTSDNCTPSIDYGSHWNSQQVTHIGPPQMIQQQSSVDEFPVGASANRGYSPPSANIKIVQQQMGQLNMGPPSQGNIQQKRNNDDRFSRQSNNGLQNQHDRKGRPLNAHMPVNTANQSYTPLYGKAGYQNNNNNNKSSDKGVNQIESTTWADMVKKSGNCSMGETRQIIRPNNEEQNYTGRRSHNGFQSQNKNNNSNSMNVNGPSTFSYGSNYQNAGQNHVNYCSQSEISPNKVLMDGSGSYNANSLTFPTRIAAYATLPKNAQVIQPRQMSVSAQYGPNSSSNNQFSRFTNGIEAIPQPFYVSRAGFPPNGFLMNQQQLPQDEKFKNTWLDQSQVPLKQIATEQWSVPYVAAHNQSMMLCRNAKSVGTKSCACPHSGSLLMTAMQLTNQNHMFGPHVRKYGQPLKNKRRSGKAEDTRQSPKTEVVETAEETVLKTPNNDKESDTSGVEENGNGSPSSDQPSDIEMCKNGKTDEITVPSKETEPQVATSG